MLKVLRILKFPELFVKWIEVCITGPRFSIVLNGSLEGYSKGAKGIRQGDIFCFIFL